MSSKNTQGTYINLYRGSETLELLKNPNAFALLTQIAIRAKRTNTFNVNSLKVGQAYIGDFKTIGMTEMQYRTAKHNLQKWGFITCQATNRGTIATLLNSAIYDINTDDVTGKVTDKQRTEQQAGNGQITTNKNDNNEKNDKKEDNYRSFGHLSISKKEFNKLIEAGFSQIQVDDILDSIQNNANNHKYTSLYLTANKWLKSNNPAIGKTDHNYTPEQLRIAKGQFQAGMGIPEWFNNAYTNLLQ